MFQTKFIEENKTQIVSITFVRKSSRLLVEIYGRAGQATDDNMVHALRILDS